MAFENLTNFAQAVRTAEWTRELFSAKQKVGVTVVMAIKVAMPALPLAPIGSRHKGFVLEPSARRERKQKMVPGQQLSILIQPALDIGGCRLMSTGMDVANTLLIHVFSSGYWPARFIHVHQHSPPGRGGLRMAAMSSMLR